MAEAAAQFVQQQIKALNRILNSLQNAEEDLTKGQNLTRAEVQCLVQLTGEQAVAGLRKQVAAWEAILAGEQPEAVVRLL
jgi:prefoldin subunit 5